MASFQINFDDFKEIFVSLLTQSQQNNNGDEQYTRLEPNDAKGVSFGGNQKHSNSYHNSNANTEQYLRSIWDRLGVGQNGYLNIDELHRVCEHIGMCGVNGEVIEQLFDKLDYDQDGKVSFDEFLDGLFQYGSALCDETGTTDNLIDTNSNVNLSVQLHSDSAVPLMASASDNDISSLNHCQHSNESEDTRLEDNSDLVREHDCHDSSFYTSSPYLITLDPDRNG